MAQLSLSADAFSHSQIKSKLWLARNFSVWHEHHMQAENRYILNWYGSWVGLGPFLFLSQLPQVQIAAVRLYDVNAADLQASFQVLNYWNCESMEITLHAQDVNEIAPENRPNQIFVNTSCEHILSDRWLAQIPAGSFVLLQSTNMPHEEHVNCPTDLEHFREIYTPHLEVFDCQQLDFSYPDKVFSRFMLFGVRK